MRARDKQKEECNECLNQEVENCQACLLGTISFYEKQIRQYKKSLGTLLLSK